MTPASALGTLRPWGGLWRIWMSLLSCWGRLWRHTDESPYLCSGEEGTSSSRTGCLQGSVLWAGRLSLPWQGQGGGPAAGPWPGAAGPAGQDSVSWEGSSPTLQLLLLGGLGSSHLSAETSTQEPAPRRAQPQDPLQAASLPSLFILCRNP